MSDEAGGAGDPLPDAATDYDWEVLQLSPAERRERGIDEETVHRTFLDVVQRGDAEAKRLEGITLPKLDLSHLVVQGATRHPIDLRGATVEGPVDLSDAEVHLPIRLDEADVGGIDAEETHFRADVSLSDATIRGPVGGVESTFEGNAEFDGVTFTESVVFDEATFHDEARFHGATFTEHAAFCGVTFHGGSNELDDNATFHGATFETTADFSHAEFGHVRFDGAGFADVARFRRASFDGEIRFDAVVFDAEADFTEAVLGGDADFSGTTFHGPGTFDGARFEGGHPVLTADTTFEGATFHDEADFRFAGFRSVSFADVAFHGPLTFREVAVGGDADFSAAVFRDVTDFDESRFGEDTNFSTAHFHRTCSFRGAEFRGGANHHELDANFNAAVFDDDADFEDAWFGSADFVDTRFGGAISFRDVDFDGEIAFKPVETDDDTYVDFTEARLKEGYIEQPAEDWVRYDLTLASVGEIAFRAERPEDSRKVFDYVRFCVTEFNEFDGHDFDFTGHLDYLDRNDWALHKFETSNQADYEFAREMTPANVELTYLKAKLAASDAGVQKAAGEFRVKRQQFARRKHLDIARDSGESLLTRVRQFGEIAENVFLGITCGYGLRIRRIIAVFFLAPLLPAMLYAFGGPAFKLKGIEQPDGPAHLLTPAGQSLFFEHLHFSYISYLTIGYGGVLPEGPLASVLAGLEVYLSVVLGGLVVYALVKRSEV